MLHLYFIALYASYNSEFKNGIEQEIRAALLQLSIQSESLAIVKRELHCLKNRKKDLEQEIERVNNIYEKIISEYNTGATESMEKECEPGDKVDNLNKKEEKEASELMEKEEFTAGVPEEEVLQENTKL